MIIIYTRFTWVMQLADLSPRLISSNGLLSCTWMAVTQLISTTQLISATRPISA